ncbi:zinc-type alcohol dehydrogenase-like protein C1773.06c [Aspergillus udagawae]|uniref:Zinc-type alcohol dehydrogenase-like protein C1773.06c n=1 Tax=Aspergillus udagawae TaxID=91492 RepID=A0ABQ1AHP2_9EURO|nr:zinc-type alcohol dehydrogenase-like protein C1773.06c [Aspergillus udagawae]
MKAVRLTTVGEETRLEMRDEPLPNPGRHEVLVRVHAASLNFRDHAMAPVKSSALGTVFHGSKLAIESSPTASCTGSAARFFRNTTRAASDSAVDGMLAEYVVLPETALVHLPASVSYIEAASLPCAAGAAWSSLNLATPLQPGQTVLVQGTGGVALFALQIARMFGARVLAITSSDEKAAKLKELGAESVVNYNTCPDWDREILALTDGQGVDKVIDIAGEKTIVKSAASARIRGEIALVGSASGFGGGLSPVDILYRSLIIGSSTIGPRTNLETLLKAMTMHGVRPVIDRVYPFAEYREAYQQIQSGEHIGKVVIDVAH